MKHQEVLENKYKLDRLLLIATAVIAYLILLFSNALPYETWFNVINIFAQEQPYAFYPLLASNIIIFLCLLIKTSGLHVRQKVGLFQIGAGTGVALVLICFLYSAIVSPSTIDVARVCDMAIISIVSACMTVFLIIRVRNYSTPPVNEVDQDDLSVLKDWVVKDTDSPAKFVTGRKEQVDRIAKALNDGTCHRGIVLHGAFRSGKTTLMNSVERQLKENWCVVKLSAWGKEHLVETIMTELISTLGRRFETHSVRALPRELADSLGHTLQHPVISLPVLASFQKKRSDLEILGELECLLAHHNLHCLLVIEDLDRSLTREKDINQLGALLNNLTNNDRFRFALTIDRHPDFNEVLTKLFDLKVDISTLDIVPILMSFLQLCRQEARDKNIILVDLMFGQPDYSEEDLRAWESRHSLIGDHILVALSQILREVGILRQVLKATWQKWLNVMGNINPVDLLVHQVIMQTEGGSEAKEYIQNYLYQPEKGLVGKVTEHLKNSAGKHREADRLTPDNLREILNISLENSPEYIPLVEYCFKPNGAKNYQSFDLLNNKVNGLGLFQCIETGKEQAGQFVTQSKLKNWETLWTTPEAVPTSILEDVINRQEEYEHCLHAYAFSHSSEGVKEGHGNALVKLLNYMFRNKRIEFEYGQYTSGAYILRRFIKPFDGRELNPRNTLWQAWFDRLMPYVEHHPECALLVLFNFDNTFRNPSNAANRGEEKQFMLAEFMNFLAKNIAIEVMLESPLNIKWDVVSKYDHRINVADHVKSIIASNLTFDVVNQSAKLLAPALVNEASNIRIKGFCEMIGLTPTITQAWCQRLAKAIEDQIKRGLKSDGDYSQTVELINQHRLAEFDPTPAINLDGVIKSLQRVVAVYSQGIEAEAKL